MDAFVIPWLLSGLSVAGLIACVEYNRRTGFRKVRAMEPMSDDPLLWIGSATELPAALKLQQIAAAEAATEQPAQVPVDVQGEYAIAAK
jgi:hypothetical protein